MLLTRLSLLMLIPFAVATAFFGLGLHTQVASTAQATAAEPDTKTPAGFHTVKLNGHTFTLPDGFTIELAAGPSLAERPVSGSFDEKGRLYVTDSSGDNSKAPEQAKTKTHRIRRLEDTNGDGVFDKSTLFVKNVAMPQGAMFYKGSLYVAAPPQIVKFTDTNDDGIADKEDVWFDGKTVGGCGNDVHGPWVGPDGWFYWTKGGFEKQEYTLPNGKKWSTRAAHVFRAKPDGTSIEPVMTGGMDNPVGLTFTRTGEVLVCGTFFQHPADGKRDGIIHAVYGGVFGKDHSPIYEHPWTGPSVLPIMTHLGPAAACALTRFREQEQPGKTYLDTIYCCQFNLRKVSEHKLVPVGGAYEVLSKDYLVSDSIDFHPTDVIQDTDGSLLIIDTGGWYKLCCPTSQLAKVDVTGAIYRVRKTGMPRTRVEIPQPKLSKLYELSLNRDPAGIPEALAALDSKNIQVVHQGLQALGRLGNASHIDAILKAIPKSRSYTTDHHIATYALIEIGDATALRQRLANLAAPNYVADPVTQAYVRRALLIAIDQLPDGKLDPKFVLAELDSTLLKETAWWIAGRHPEWGSQLAGYFRDRLKSIDTMTAPEQDALAARFAPFLKSSEVGAAVNDALHRTILPSSQAALLRGLAKSGLRRLPAEWIDGVQHALLSTNENVLKEAFALLRTVPPTVADYAVLLENVTKLRRRTSPLAKEHEYTLRAAAPAGTAMSAADAEAVIASLHRDQPGNLRAAAADWLPRAALPTPSLVALAAALKMTTPVEFAKLLPAFASTKEPEVGLAFVAALSDPAVRKLVRAEQVKPILDKYPAAVKLEAEKLYALLAEDRKAERAKLDSLIAAAPKGDERRGQVVFNSAKAACIACHKIGYVGGNVGPDLRRIGAVRTERDLMEAIVFPSASFVRSYEPFRIVTASGKAYNGVLRKDAPDEVVLAVAADQEVRIPRADIEEMTPSTVSVMPAGLDQQLSPQDLADLVAFLKANVK